MRISRYQFLGIFLEFNSWKVLPFLVVLLMISTGCADHETVSMLKRTAADVENGTGDGSWSQIESVAFKQPKDSREELRKGDLKLLANLTDLKRVTFEGRENIELSDLPRNLRAMWITDSTSSQFDSIGYLTQLRELWLVRLDLHDIRFVRSLPSLTHTVLQELPLSRIPEEWEVDELTHLRVVDCKNLNEVSALKRAGNLESVQFESCPSISDLSFLAETSKVRKIQIENTPFDAAQLGLECNAETLFIKTASVIHPTAIGNLKGLTHLRLEACDIRDLSFVIELHRLDQLEIIDCPEVDLKSLVSESSITVLKLRGAAVSDLSIVENTPNLKLIYAGDTSVSDLEPISKLESLESLWLSNTDVTALGPISGMKAIRDLRLDGAKVRDLKPLHGVKIQRLSIVGCPIEPSSLEQFRTSHPDCEVVTE